MPSELDLGAEPVLECRQAQLFEPRDRALEEALERKVHVGRPPPESKGISQRLGALERWQRHGVADEALESVRVNRSGVDPQRIARRNRLDRGGPDGLPETRNRVLDDCVGCCRRRHAPKIVDQPIGRDHRPEVDEELGQHGAWLWPAERERLAP